MITNVANAQQISINVVQEGEYAICTLSIPSPAGLLVIRETSRRPVDAIAFALANLSESLLALPREEREKMP